MAFVSEQCIDKWFQTDSWVYKNFSYLFKNPVMNKNVPEGFSLCPYFWMAIFSLLIFKPIVVPSILFFKFIFKEIFRIGGKKLKKIDYFLGKYVSKMIGKSYETGDGIAGGLLLMVLCVITYAVSISLGYMYENFISADLKIQIICVWATINLVCVLTTGIYNSCNKYNASRCKVEWYSLLCFVVTTGIFAFVTPDTFVDMGNFIFAITMEVVVTMGSAFYVIGLGIWNGLSFIFPYVVTILFYILSAIAVMFLVGAVMMRIVQKLDRHCDKKLNSKKPKLTKDDWINLIIKSIEDDDSIIYDIDHLIKSNTKNNINDGALVNDNAISLWDNYRYQNSLYIIRLILEKKIKIPKSLMDMKYSDYLKLYEKVSSTRIELDADFLNYWSKELKISHIRGDLICVFDDLKALLYSDCDWIKNEDVFDHLNQSFAEIKVKINNEREKIIDEKNKKAKIKKKKHESCKKFSNLISNFFLNIFKFIRKVFYEWMILIPIKIVWWILRNVGILIVYLWVVVKHVKKGACPYRHFIDQSE